MKFSQIFVAVAILVSIFSSKAHAVFDPKSLDASLAVCQSETAAVDCFDRLRVSACGNLKDQDKGYCEALVDAAWNTCERTKAVAQANKAKAELKKLQVQPAPVAQPVATVPKPAPAAPITVVTAAPPRPVKIPLGKTAMTTVLLSKPGGHSGSISGLSDHGQGAYAIFMNGIEVMDVSQTDPGGSGEYIPIVPETAVDLDGDGYLDPMIEVNKVQLVPASNRSVYLPGNARDGLVTLRWVYFEKDDQGVWFPIKYATVRLDFTGGGNPYVSTGSNVNEFRYTGR